MMPRVEVHRPPNGQSHALAKVMMRRMRVTPQPRRKLHTTQWRCRRCKHLGGMRRMSIRLNANKRRVHIISKRSFPKNQRASMSSESDAFQSSFSLFSTPLPRLQQLSALVAPPSSQCGKTSVSVPRRLNAPSSAGGLRYGGTASAPPLHRTRTWFSGRMCRTVLSPSTIRCKLSQAL